MVKSDFSIFDLSGWNPNVALELGCAEGLKRNSAKDYYMLLNSRRSTEVPSDIRGLQRLEYTSYDYKPATGLGDALVNQILSKEYWVKKIWREISGTDKAEKKKLLALRILAHLRDHEKLSPDNLKSLVRGTRLRKTDSDRVLSALQKHRLIRRIGRTNVFRQWRNLFKTV